MSEDSVAIDDSLEQAAGIVAAYVSNNSLRASDLPELIAAVHASIRQLTHGTAPAVAAVPEEPAVPIKKSVTRDYVICLEDGKKFKSLRRHLSSHHNLTPEQYRAKWNLAADHPIVAPSYSATRSQLARDAGLGQIGGALAASAAPAPREAPSQEAAPAKKRGRKKKDEAGKAE